jgi:hypothetical protein
MGVHMDLLAIRKTTSGRLRRQYPREFSALCEILYDEDPIAINFGVNPDEYEIEAGMILPRLRGCLSAADVLTVVYEEFGRAFSADVAGKPDRYRIIASRIWNKLPGWFRRSEGLLDRGARDGLGLRARA